MQREMPHMNEYDPSTMEYNDEKYFLGPYYYYNPNNLHPYSLRIMDFKDKNPNFKEKHLIAIEYFKHAIGLAVLRIEDELLEDASDWYMIAMPPHMEGQSNEPCETLCNTLARQ